MILESPLSLAEAVNTFNEQVDAPPSPLSMLISLNGSYWRGTSTVCGAIKGNSFTLMNRQGPAFSLKAKGNIAETPQGILVELDFVPSLIPDITSILPTVL